MYFSCWKFSGEIPFVLSYRNVVNATPWSAEIKDKWETSLIQKKSFYCWVYSSKKIELCSFLLSWKILFVWQYRNDLYSVFFKWPCMVQVPNFWGVSGSEDRSRDDNNVQFINIGRVGDKSFKELRWGIGGRKVGDNNFDFFMQLSQQKKCHFKILHFGQLFCSYLLCFVNVDFLLAWNLCHQARNRLILIAKMNRL